MNKRSLGMMLTVGILTVATACQSKTPRVPAASMTTQEQQPSSYTPLVESEDEDIDLHVYGTNDTSTSWDNGVVIEPESVIADIHEVLSNTLPIVAQGEVGEVVVLEVVPPVEVVPEHQEN